jgi:hypothetical protein
VSVARGNEPVLNAVTVPEHVSLCRSRGRVREIETIISELRTSFPNIEYELDAISRTANAQAYARADTRVVRLYGGLAFHPMIGPDALVFALLHEIGHHFAGGRRFANDPMLACDCSADQWAVTEGAEVLQRVSGRRLDIVKALDELDAMICSISSYRLSSGRRRSDFPWQGCWASHWPTRKFRLGSGRETGVARRCLI